MILLKNLMMNESLTEYEKNLIYGNLLENINDVVIMNEADANREQRLALNQSGEAFKNASKAPNGIDKAELISTGTKLKYIAAQNGKKAREQEKDVISGENIKEAVNPIDNQIAAAKKGIEAVEKAKENADIRYDKNLKFKRERLEFLRHKKEQVANTSSGKTEVQTQTSLGESTQPLTNPTEFLFKTKDESGKLLDHFINKKSLQEYSLQQLAQDLESNSEAQAIIKKIEFYIKKMGSGLDYDSYIDLKVQNGKFRALVKKTKEDRLNKIRS